MQNQTISRLRILLLLSVSALALSSAGVVAQSGGGFLIEAPAARPAALPVVRPAASPAANAFAVRPAITRASTRKRA